MAPLLSKDRVPLGKGIEPFRLCAHHIVIKTLRIDLETTKFGEGPYDPATGICEFKIAPEFYEAMPNAKHDDFIRRAAFSRKGDKIQFELIVVGQDEDSVTIGIKNE